MPGGLPPALLARLKKRGILPRESKPEQEEEVIAEDYDEPSKLSSSTTFQDQVPGCPNKYNIYHDCSEYCARKFGSGTETPPSTIKRKYNRLLKSFPLPENWKSVWEPGTFRYYFWNLETDEVSWYPPGHPDFKSSLPVPKLKALLKEEEEKLAKKSAEESDEELDSMSESDESELSYDSMDSDRSDDEKRKRKVTSSHSRSPYGSSSNRRKVGRNDLDPMDPASYSDSCPRGKWSDGLDADNPARTGVDSTVSGPLYQARPYPSPGAVLRMNKS